MMPVSWCCHRCFSLVMRLGAHTLALKTCPCGQSSEKRWREVWTLGCSKGSVGREECVLSFFLIDMYLECLSHDFLEVLSFCSEYVFPL